MSPAVLPLADIRVVKHMIPAYKLIPNTSLQNKPLLLYRSAFSKQHATSDIEHHLRSTGVVTPHWRYTMYSESHFHSTTHEVLAIARGSAELCFGHEDNPSNVKETVHRGDVIVVPAGVSHRLINDLSGDFLMVGSYPNGKQWDMCCGHEEERTKIEAIKMLPWFDRDPVYGDRGPVLDV